MSQISITHSVAMKQLKQQVYVDIPSPPIPLSRYSAMGKLNTTPHVHVASGLLKENTPLSPTLGSLINPGPPFRKRKHSERDPPPSTPGFLVNTKKQKLTKASVQESSSPQPSAPVPPPGSNMSLYCHQCSRKYDVAVSVQCTTKLIFTSKDGNIKERRCSGKFCGKCLKSRYGENIDEIKNIHNRKQEYGHIESTSYTFKCPKCRGICNCWSCRRSKGLEPLGRLNPVAPEISAARILVQNPDVTSLKAKAGVASIPQGATLRKELAGSKDSALKKQKSKPPTLINWTNIAAQLSRDQVEMRFQIREFMLRFTCIMEPTISKTHLEELDAIHGSSRRSEDMMGWVSETCVRAILLGTLYLLIDRAIENPIRATIKDIRTSGANLNKMWLALLLLRRSVASTLDSPGSGEEPKLSFPDPLPPPSSVTVHTTRNMRNSSMNSVQVLNSAQMVPVLNALIEAALDTDLVREELENGVRKGREITREVRECLKKENDEWDIERKRTETAQDRSKEMRSKREAHKQRAQHLENALKVMLPSFSPRFTPLGHDIAGRVYYALSPGVTERRAAATFITSNTTVKYTKKGKTKVRIWDEDERSMMKDWSCFVGVWGKRPSNEMKTSGGETKANHIFHWRGTSNNADAGNEKDEDAEKWWGFYQPQDIQNIAEWIATSLGTADETPNNSHSSLVKNLKDYATLLEWRIRNDEYEVLSKEKLV